MKVDHTDYPQSGSADLSQLNPAQELTPREIEILEWISRGKTNKQIGLILNISSRTAAKHLERIFIKLNVQSRTSAVVQFLMMLQPSSLTREVK